MARATADRPAHVTFRCPPFVPSTRSWDILVAITQSWSNIRMCTKNKRQLPVSIHAFRNCSNALQPITWYSVLGSGRRVFNHWVEENSPVTTLGCLNRNFNSNYFATPSRKLSCTNLSYVFRLFGVWILIKCQKDKKKHHLWSIWHDKGKRTGVNHYTQSYLFPPYPTINHNLLHPSWPYFSL